MQFRLVFAVALLSVALLSFTAANAQCRLATSEGQDTGPDYSSLDLSVLDEIDPLAPEFSEAPPYHLDLLSQRAYEAHTAGEIELATKLYLFISEYRRDSRVLYNLACAYGLLNKPELAAAALEYAFQSGYTNLDWLYQDADFDQIRAQPVFAEVVDEWAQLLAERADQGGESVYIAYPAIQKYNVQLPADFDAANSYPLVIGLHGGLGTADNFSRLYQSFEDPQFIYVAAQAPYCIDAVDPSYVWFGGMPYENEAAAAESRDLNSGYILSIADGLKKQYKIDDVYLIGFSQGGMMACHTLLGNLGLIDGAICFGGSLVADWASDELMASADGARIFIAHGDDDHTEFAYSARDLLEGAGADVTYREFSGGHYINLEALLEAQAWMAE